MQMHQLFTTQGLLVTSEGKALFEILWAKKKMLITSIFSFSLNGFYPIKDKFSVLSNI